MNTPAVSRAELAAQILQDLDTLRDLADTIGNTVKGQMLLDPEHTPQHPAYAPYALRDLDLKSFLTKVSDMITGIGDRVRTLADPVALAKGEYQ